MDQRGIAYDAFERRDWPAAYDALHGLDATDLLTAADHDALAETAHCSARCAACSTPPPANNATLPFLRHQKNADVEW